MRGAEGGAGRRGVGLGEAQGKGKGMGFVGKREREEGGARGGAVCRPSCGRVHGSLLREGHMKRMLQRLWRGLCCAGGPRAVAGAHLACLLCTTSSRDNNHRNLAWPLRCVP